MAEPAKMMAQTDRGVLVVLSHWRPCRHRQEHDFVHKVLAKDVDARKMKIDKIVYPLLITVDADADLLQGSKSM